MDRKRNEVIRSPRSISRLRAAWVVQAARIEGYRVSPQRMSGKKERITVSLDPGVAAGLKAAAEQAGAASVSEYVEGALDARMLRDQWLARWRAAVGDVDPEALAYARRALLGERVEQHPQVS